MSRTESDRVGTWIGGRVTLGRSSHIDGFEISTAAPETSTEEPEMSTEEPETSTEEPETSTEAPETSTEAPETSTAGDPEISVETVTVVPEISTGASETSVASKRRRGGISGMIGEVHKHPLHPTAV